MNYKLIFNVLLFTCFLHQANSQNIVYVNAAAAGANNGSSWTNAYTDLSQAIKSAPSGAQLWVTNGTYVPTAPDTTFKIVKPLRLLGGFSGNETSIQQRVLNKSRTILSGERGTVNEDDNLSVVLWADHLKDSLILDGFRFEKTRIRRGNYYFAGITLYSTKTRIQNCIFENKISAPLAGTHIYADTLGLLIRNSEFVNNVTDYSDLIHSIKNNLTIESSVFENNKNDGFGIINYDGIGSVLTVRNTTFRNNNKAEIHILANYAFFDNCLFENHVRPRTYLIYVSGADSLVINNSKFLNNATGSALVYTGPATIRNTVFQNGDDNAIYQFGGTLTVYDCIFDNFKAGSGGAIYCNSGNFNNTKFINNVSGMGGAVYSQNLKANNCVFENNKAGYAGGFYTSNIFNISNCTFKNNISESQGGAFFGSKGGVSGSRFENNFTRYTGGAIVSFDSTVVQSSVFINNGIPDTSSTGPSSSGGAIYCGGNTWVYNSLFIRNSAYNGAALQAGGETVIANSTFFKNSSPVDTNNGAFSHYNNIQVVSSIFWNPSIDEFFTSNSGNETVNYSVVKGSINGTGNTSVEPLLDELGIPKAGSVSIDKGIISNIAKIGNTDVYGNPRVNNNTIDIGAVEYQIVSSVENVLGDQHNFVYPNPVINGGILKIDLAVNGTSQHAEIYDQRGNKVMQQIITGSEINIGSLTHGIYMLVLSSENGLKSKGKFLVE